MNSIFLPQCNQFQGSFRADRRSAINPGSRRKEFIHFKAGSTKAHLKYYEKREKKKTWIKEGKIGIHRNWLTQFFKAFV